MMCFYLNVQFQGQNLKWRIRRHEKHLKFIVACKVIRSGAESGCLFEASGVTMQTRCLFHFLHIPRRFVMWIHYSWQFFLLCPPYELLIIHKSLSQPYKRRKGINFCNSDGSEFKKKFVKIERRKGCRTCVCFRNNFLIWPFWFKCRIATLCLMVINNGSSQAWPFVKRKSKGQNIGEWWIGNNLKLRGFAHVTGGDREYPQLW